MCDAGAVGERGRVEFSPAMVVGRAGPGADTGRDNLRDPATTRVTASARCNRSPAPHDTHRPRNEVPNTPPRPRRVALAGAALGLLALSARLRTLAVAPLLVFAALGTALPAAAQMTINMGADASLSALSVPGGRSNPPFTPGRLNHSTTVDDTVSRVTVTATPSQPGATVEYLKTNFSALQDADPSSADTFEVDLGTRLNTYFRVRVTGTDGHTTRTYLLNVHRSARSNNAPTVSNEIPDRTATTGTAFKYAFPSDTFSDVDRDALTYTATKAGRDRVAHVGWLSPPPRGLSRACRRPRTWRWYR